jgi:transposase
MVKIRELIMAKAKLSIPVYAAGIDVGSETLVLVIRKNGNAYKPQKFDNTPADRMRLAKKLAGLENCTVSMEATGVYSLDIAVVLHDAGVRVMVLNPKAAHNFAKVLLCNAKTDEVDADVLAQYAERMPYQAWQRPSNEALSLRAFSRRINALTRQRAATKNQLHAASFTPDTPEGVIDDLKEGIAQLEARIERLSEGAKKLIEQTPLLQQRFELLVSIKGIAQTSAIALLGEFMLLPAELTHKQWVKHAGLDPRPFQSGKSVHQPSKLSKAGNRYIRHALYMPALSAKMHDANVRAFAEHLLAQGKKRLQVVCAVMRKLLHAIWGMFKSNQKFDSTRFYRAPQSTQPMAG